MRSVSVSIQPVGDIHVNLASFTRSLRATNLSPRTIQSYAESTELLAGFLTEHGLPTTVVAIQLPHSRNALAPKVEALRPSRRLRSPAPIRRTR